MRNFINKNSIAAFMLAANVSITSTASALELTLPVNIEQVGKMKFLVRAEPKSSLTVIIYDAENNVLHNEQISSQKLFSFSDLFRWKIPNGSVGLSQEISSIKII
jgi:hypothetical protein